MPPPSAMYSCTRVKNFFKSFFSVVSKVRFDGGVGGLNPLFKSDEPSLQNSEKGGGGVGGPTPSSGAP